MKHTPTQVGATIPLIYHFAMLQDQQRMEGFKEAIALSVPVGGKVLELGGGTGVLSFYAAQRASKVYCVERIAENAAAARKNLDQNKNGDRVEVICADALEYLPPEPVDVVICEMLHVGMIRERQIEVISSFKERYRAKFGEKLPRFIPEAFIQGIQPINYDFTFSGYFAPVPLFQAPGVESPACKELGSPVLYQVAEYRDPLSTKISWKGSLSISTTGNCNAVRVILKNLLAILPTQNRSIAWHNQYLILPLSTPCHVSRGSQLGVNIEYLAGCEVEEKISKAALP
jgi:protein arginine N-methyltransferase 1